MCIRDRAAADALPPLASSIGGAARRSTRRTLAGSGSQALLQLRRSASSAVAAPYAAAPFAAPAQAAAAQRGGGVAHPTAAVPPPAHSPRAPAPARPHAPPSSLHPEGIPVRSSPAHAPLPPPPLPSQQQQPPPQQPPQPRGLLPSASAPVLGARVGGGGDAPHAAAAAAVRKSNWEVPRAAVNLPPKGGGSRRIRELTTRLAPIRLGARTPPPAQDGWAVQDAGECAVGCHNPAASQPPSRGPLK